MQYGSLNPGNIGFLFGRNPMLCLFCQVALHDIEYRALGEDLPEIYRWSEDLFMDA